MSSSGVDVHSLVANKVRDLLVLGLLDGALIVLRALTEELLLHKVDA